MPGRGGGGSGGRGGNASRKRKLAAESQEEKTARRKVATDLWAQKSPEEREVVNNKKRECRRRTISVQEATHLLLGKLFPASSELLGEQKCVIKNFLGAVNSASYIAADQAKAVSMQIQLARPGQSEIAKETHNTNMRNKLSDFAEKFGLIQVCQCVFTNEYPDPPAHTHLLESHAQHTMIDLASRDPDSTLYQFYNASAGKQGGMSVLKVGALCDGAFRVLAITTTVWAKDPSRIGKEAFSICVFDSHTDDVFGDDAFAVRPIVM